MKRLTSFLMVCIMLLGMSTSAFAANAAENVAAEGGYAAVTTANERVQGFYNDEAALKVELAGRYNSGAMSADGGSLEIVQYNPTNGFAYAVSGLKGKLIAVNLNENMDSEKAAALSGTEYDLKEMLTNDNFKYGDMTSVAVSADGSKLAAAVQAENYVDNGIVALFSCKADGTLDLINTATVGVQPDMVTFADDNTILTADEGEPREGANGTDPKGSVTIVTVDGDNLTANTVTFDSFDEKRDELAAKGVLIQKGLNPSTDFEPEYIAVADERAYISLQEANAVAVLDIDAAVFTGVYPLGFQDYGTTKIDLEKNEKIELKNYKNVYGIKMPDGIYTTKIGGKTYFLTANEGDSRSDWAEMDNEVKEKTSPTGNVKLDKKVTWFDATKWDGLDQSKAYVFGGRSFSVYEVNDAGIDLVYDSASGFEQLTSEKWPLYFNCSNDNTELDDRSGKKGPEPETVVTGTVDGRNYAFIALERIGGVMIYDITDIGDVKFVNYINSREFEDNIQGDVSPEGLCFVPAKDGKKAMLLAACEVSGTLAVYELSSDNKSQPSEGEWDIAVISDDHLYDADELGANGAAFAQYLASDRKLLRESEAILDAALAEIAQSGVKYLLISGDLTKDGEKLNHELLAQKLAKLEADTDIEVFVINGNHDISNSHAVKFSGDATESVATVNTDDFREIYNDFGYAQAVAQDTNSLSYAVDLGEDYRLIVMDACIYNNDIDNPAQETRGEFKNETLNWVLAQIKAAIKDGRRPIGMMHHGLLPHTAIEPTMFSEYLVEDYENVAAKLADAGMNLVFTGHFHSQDAAMMTTDKGSVLYDVETGSLVTSPCPIRYVALNGDKFSYTTTHVTKVAGYENFPEHAAAFLRSGMAGLVDNMLPNALRALGVTDETQIAAICSNEDLKALLVGGFVAHYAGDETIDDATKAGLAQLAKINKQLAQIAGSLYTDEAPADCAAQELSLTALPEYKSNSGSYGGAQTEFIVDTAKADNGSLSVSQKEASAGTMITVTVTPNDGYKTDNVAVSDKNGNKFTVKNVGENKYAFTMPSANVGVKASFVKTDGTTDSKKAIIMQIGNKSVNAYGKTIASDAAPLIINDRTMVPVRIVTETLGGTADWNADTQTVTLKIDDKTISMTIGVVLEKYGAAPIIIDGRTYVPIRFVAEELGASVEWNESTKEIVITK